MTAPVAKYQLPHGLKNALLSRIDSSVLAVHTAISAHQALHPSAQEAHSAVNDLAAVALEAGYDAGFRDALGEDVSRMSLPNPITQLRLDPSISADA